MEISKKQLRKSSYSDYLISSKIEDPVLRHVLGSFVNALVITGVVMIFVAWAFDYGGFHKAALATSWYLMTVPVYLLLLKLGYHRVARYGYVFSTCVLIFFGDQLLGTEAYYWVYYLTLPSGALFLSTAQEKIFRIFCFATAIFFLLASALCHIFDLFTPESTQLQHTTLVRIGIFIVGYNAFSMLKSIIRYQNEVTRYKESLQKQSVAMLQQAKMSTLGEMAAGVAHEINNPLGIIVGKIEGLERRVDPQQTGASKLFSDYDKIKQVVQRIASIVSSLRMFARNAENDPCVLGTLDEVIQATLNLCHENLKMKKIDLRVKGDGKILFESQQAQISQILANLLNNSSDAIQNQDDKWIEIESASINAEKFQILLTDSGHGIPEAIADKIMNPFFTTKDIGKGTGLGLSVSKGIIENHGGTIVLDRNCPNTRFVIELPFRQTKSGGPTD